LIVGSSLVVLLATLCWFDNQAVRPGIFLAPLVVLLCLLATQEMLRLFRASGNRPLAWAVYVGTLLPVLASVAQIGWIVYPVNCPVGRIGWLACGLVAGLLVVLVGELVRHGRDDQQPGSTITNFAIAAFSTLYIGGLLGFLIQLRMVPYALGGEHNQSLGLIPLLSLIGTVKLSDTCQYIIGKLAGRRKLAPRLSPGKTWEGTLGGIGAAVVIASICLSVLLHGKLGLSTLGTLGQAFLYSLLICLAGIVGDLAESMLKRDAGVKDSSTWLPGMGGVLDMLDSLLVAAPVAYACWVTGLIGP